MRSCVLMFLISLCPMTECALDYVDELMLVGHPRTLVTLAWTEPVVNPDIDYRYHIEVNRTDSFVGNYDVLNITDERIVINLPPYKEYTAVFVTTRLSDIDANFNESLSAPLPFTTFDALHPVHITLYAVIAYLIFIAIFFMVLGTLCGPKEPEPI